MCVCVLCMNANDSILKSSWQTLGKDLKESKTKALENCAVPVKSFKSFHKMNYRRPLCSRIALICLSFSVLLAVNCLDLPVHGTSNPERNLNVPLSR